MTENVQRIVSLVVQEGSLIYSDDAGRENVRALSHVSATAYIAAEGSTDRPVCWRMLGPITLVAETLAILYSKEPGLKDIVDGMYSAIAKRRGL